jgi:D-alanine-D-alanine ligase-like ATP-grasp enzyme
MLDPTRHPGLLQLFSWLDRIKGFRKGRQARKRAAENLGAFYRRVWQEAAARLGATIEDLGHDVLEIRLGEARTRVRQNFTGMDDLGTHHVVRAKPVIYRMLARAGLPTPRFVTFGVEDMETAVAFLESTGKDCVVKPASGTGGGAGVTSGVRSRWQLARAAFAAGRFGRDVIIEEQVDGENYRLLYLEGQLIDAVVRRAPSVVGDGKSSLAQLVEAANAERLRQGQFVSHDLLTLDMEMKQTLARQGLSLASVPAPGATVLLKTVINQNSGADNETATPLLCASIVADGARAAAVAGVRLAGVDVITSDPRLPLRESGGVFLEVNSPPGYFWHYHKRDGAFPLAVHVLERLLSDTQGRKLCLVGSESAGDSGRGRETSTPVRRQS